MKKVTVLGVIFILLAVLVVPAMAKSPHGNGGNPDSGNTPVVAPGNKNGNGQNQNGNDGNGRGRNGNHGNGGGNQNSQRGMPFYLQGKIKSIGANTITVTLVHGNARVKEFIGGDLTLQTTIATQYFKINQMGENDDENGEASNPDQNGAEGENGEQDGSNRAGTSLDKLVIGDIVAIHGSVLNGVYTARLVTVYVRTPESVPEG